MISPAGVVPVLASAGRHTGRAKHAAAAFVVGIAVGAAIVAVAALSSLRSFVAYLSSEDTPIDQEAHQVWSAPGSSPSPGADPQGRTNTESKHDQ